MLGSLPISSLLTLYPKIWHQYEFVSITGLRYLLLGGSWGRERESLRGPCVRRSSISEEKFVEEYTVKERMKSPAYESSSRKLSEM